jgi:predicted nuclease of restriction endonuclease-like (RecB) superfamily
LRELQGTLYVCRRSVAAPTIVRPLIVAGWGKRVIDRLAEDLQKEFGAKGFSARNLRYMRDFAAAYGEVPIWQHAAAKLPWGHNQILLDKIGDPNLRNWYAEAAAKAGWKRSVLLHQIETRLHERQGKAITNFSRTLPVEEQKAAVELFKDPYLLDFIDTDGIVHERHLERALNLIERLSLELVALEQFLDHPGHARLFAGGEVARDDAVSALSHRHLSS